jgi:hypothetical protein
VTTSLLHLHGLSILTVFDSIETLGDLTHVDVDPLSSSEERALGPKQPSDVPMG